jgi:hypothetical protein
MRLSEFWRTSAFRLTVVYGLIFAIGAGALLGMVHARWASYLTDRRDRILAVEAAALAQSPPTELAQRIDAALALNGQTNVFALFSPTGQWLAGNLETAPPELKVDGSPVEIGLTPTFPAHARLIAKRLATSEELIVGRDADLLLEMRAIIASALVWSAAVIFIFGLGCGVGQAVRRAIEFRARNAALETAPL